MSRVRMTVNGREVTREVADRVHLGDFLREELGLTGTHLLENLRQILKRSSLSDQSECWDLRGFNIFQSFANRLRGVMERGVDANLIVVKASGIDTKLCSTWTASEKVHSATRPHQLHRLIPGFCLAHGFDHTVKTQLVRCVLIP